MLREEPKKRRLTNRAARRDNKCAALDHGLEIVETTRVYARTCARIDPVWALDLGAHPCA